MTKYPIYELKSSEKSDKLSRKYMLKYSQYNPHIYPKITDKKITKIKII